jgi:MoxR-like ATPase
MATAGFLRALGIVGWDALEPAILAGLATEQPILLIGPHGTAKTLVLSRLAQALGLVFRHYNASILSFDDLLGYPVPQDGRLVYLQTPATVWEAEAVLFDEVSRCRPELQNKLFPLIHERVAQGLPLTKLRHRWAAMNPPPAAEGNGEGAAAITYEGAEPLDVALADRFAFVLDAPAFESLTEEDQRTVLRDHGEPAADGADRLRRALDAARAALAEATRELREIAAEYARVLGARLGAAGHPLSTRRAVALARNVVALRAAQRTLWQAGAPPCLEDACHAAARVSLPDAAWGRPVPAHVVLAAHRIAWEAAQLAADSPERALLGEANPLRRIALALGSSLAPADAGGVIADAFASLSRPARLVSAALLFPRLASRGDLPATTLEAIAADYALVARRGEERVTVRRGGRDWKRELLGTRLAELDATRPRDAALLNAAAALMADEERFDFDALVRAWENAAAALGGEDRTPARPAPAPQPGAPRRKR